jgi:hypothetical protein
MNKILTTIVFSALFLFGVAQDNKLFAQQPTKTQMETDFRLYDEAIKKNPPDYDAAKRVRNSIIFSTELLIDINYNEFLTKARKSWKRQAKSSELIKDVKELNANAPTTSISNGERTNNVMLDSVLNLISSGRGNKKSSRAINPQILVLAMDCFRAKIAAEILKKLEQNVTEYSLDAALADLTSYFYAGTNKGAQRELGAMVVEQMDVLHKLERSEIPK